MAHLLSVMTGENRVISATRGKDTPALNENNVEKLPLVHLTLIYVIAAISLKLSLGTDS